MRYAFSTLACPDWSIERIVGQARNLGYGALELRLLDGDVVDPVADRAKIERAVAVARDAGIEVCALGTSCRLNTMDEEARISRLRELRSWIALAGELHVPVVRVFGGPDEPGVTPEMGNAAVAQALAAVAAEAAEVGTIVAIETHDAFSSAARTASALDLVPSPAIGALWDIFHTFESGETPEEAMQLLGARLAHVHVKDARRRGADWDLVLLGEGDVPLADTIQVLETSGYRGYISVEWEKKWHPEIPEPEIALPQHIAYLHSLVPGA